MSRTATRSLAHLEPVELLSELYPETTYGDRYVWLLCVAELRRSGQLPSIDALARKMRSEYGPNTRRNVSRHLARLYDCGAMTRGSYNYAPHVSLDERVFEVFPILRLLDNERAAA